MSGSAAGADAVGVGCGAVLVDDDGTLAAALTDSGVTGATGNCRNVTAPSRASAEGGTVGRTAAVAGGLMTAAGSG